MLFKKQRRRVTSSPSSKLSFEVLEPRQLLAGLDGSEVIGLPSDMIANAYVFIGDHSGSNSEKWDMAVGGRTHSAPDFGVVQRDYRQFKKGESYPVSVQHAGSIYPTGEEDFDYRAWVDRYANPTWTSGNPVPSGHEFFVTDPQQLFQRQYFTNNPGDPDPTLGKSATIHFPGIDLDIDSDSSGAVERSVSEDNIETDSTKGLLNPVTSGDIDNDGIVDRLDFNGISGFSFTKVILSLSSNVAFAASSGYGSSVNLNFTFDDSGIGTGGLFRLWKKDASVLRSSTDLVPASTSISAASLGLEPGGSVTLFLESVKPTNKTVHFDPISVTASIVGNIWQGVVSDGVYSRGVTFKGQLDLDVDSNNDGQITESDDGTETSQNAAKVRINTDDDDKNSVVDKNQTGIAAEDDLGKLKVRWNQDATSNFQNYTLSLHYGNANSETLAKVYSDSSKTTPVTLSSNLTNFSNTRTWALGNVGIDQTFFVEGLQANGAAEFVLKVWDAAGKAIQTDKVNMTIIGERIIWLTGYWNPANTTGILADFATAVEGFEKTGFTVKAYDYLVNYDDVSQKFWSTAATERPIAILSFGFDGNLNNRWEMEPSARNLPKNQWGQGTYDASGNSPGDPGYDPTTAVSTGLPAVGGSNDDHSPYGNSGGISSFNNLSSSVSTRLAGSYSNVLGMTTGVGAGALFNVVVDQAGSATVQLAGNNSGNGYKIGDVVTISDASLGAGGAPDVTLTISGIAPIQNGDAIDSTFGVNLPRTSNLPFAEITAADPAIIKSQPNSCGEFLCEYMAYTVSWYRQWTSTNSNLDRFQKTEISGFTHVDQAKSQLNGKDSVKTMLREVIKKLEPNY